MQTIITNANYDKSTKELKNRYIELNESGCFFVIFSTEYNEYSDVKYDLFDVIKYGTKIGYDYVNTIVYPTQNYQNVAFFDNIKYIIWFAKNHKKIQFNKDAIREKHIWKDVEWGKRSKNYNPKGKDPGNVWIPTEDDGKAHITKHILLEEKEIIDKLIAMTEANDNYIYIKDEDNHQNKNNSLKTINQNEKSISTENTYDVVFSSSETMSLIKDNTVKSVVTSPPYWNLKDYYKEGQIGQESYEQYLNRMKQVWKQCYYKLTSDGVLWININTRVVSGKVIAIPYDFITICKEIGFHYKGILIWHKSSGIPTNDKNIVDRHEYVLLFTKDSEQCINLKKLQTYNDYKNDVINGKAFWNINRKAGSVGKKYIHPAIYPTELSTRLIEISSNLNDTILDPFLGSGTTLISAFITKRSAIGYEYNEGFKELIESRFTKETPDMNVRFSDLNNKKKN